MVTVKGDIKQGVDSRRAAALAVLKPQWRRCFWTRPRGHIRDGTRSHSHHYQVCLYCGSPEFGLPGSVLHLEMAVAEMSRYPLALGEEKGTVAA